LFRADELIAFQARVAGEELLANPPPLRPALTFNTHDRSRCNTRLVIESVLENSDWGLVHLSLI
jgi:hypothetical protein